MPLITRCSVFKDHPAGLAGLATSTLCSIHEKGPSIEGPEITQPLRGRSDSSYEAALFVIRSKSDRGV
jgi:hypothetical protein